MTMTSVSFVDAQAMQKAHPSTFDAPSIEEMRKGVKPGDFLKVCAENRERFWTKVRAVDGDHITATVANTLSQVRMDFGQEVHFDLCHAYAWMRQEEAMYVDV